MKPFERIDPYPAAVCMMCGEECETCEHVQEYFAGAFDQLWCYCEACDVDTFHPLEAKP